MECNKKNSLLKDYLCFKSQETFSEFDFLFEKVEIQLIFPEILCFFSGGSEELCTKPELGHAFHDQQSSILKALEIYIDRMYLIYAVKTTTITEQGRNME